MVYTNQMKVQYYDCDVNNQLKMSGVMKYMQQTSGDQLEHLGLPYEKLHEERMVFLLSKMCIKIHRMPVSSQMLTIGTAATATKGARFVREFFIDSTANNRRLVSAITLWMLVDPQTRRILRPKGFPYPFPFNASIVDSEIRDIPIPRLPEEGGGYLTQIPVRYSHVDCNAHVNNSVYGDFVCDALPYDELVTRGIDTLVISFQNEAKWGDLLSMETYSLSPEKYFVFGQHNSIPCFQAVVQLTEKSLAHSNS